VENLSKYGIRIVLADTPEDISRILKAILDRCDYNKEYEILVGQDERNKFLVKHFEHLAQFQGSTPPKIRMCQVFSSFAISDNPEYAKMEPTIDVDNHMAMLIRERNALENLVSAKGAQLDLLLCPPTYFQAQHKIRYRNILDWLKTHETLKNIRVRCGKLDFYRNTVIVENDFSILADYNPRSGYDENRVYRDQRRIDDHIETFDRQFESAELSRNIQETIKLYELMLNRFHVEKNAEWVLVNSEVKHQWMRFQLKTDITDVPGHGELRYTYVDHPGSVLIVPILPSGKLILVEQYRYLMGANSIEFPSGGLEQSDITKLLCAQRELEEETAYISTQWEQLIEFYTTNGLTNEVMTIFVATGIERKQDAHFDSAEIKGVKEFSVGEVQKLISDRIIRPDLT
jgi:ADP-ribose pyrophosphatase